mmetsp:Transcript_2178/g.3141  ORF Transcript_2178/g.3141 Transcript_2178/m.3141 type:complete len:380 (+) Transcript_2178:111-1250(+)|eukprot:CAMPEP_0178908382 /NCGR_PEP_ID=MMETSP0786-20121207/7893_1 /TAXON_ID=186022 /ORGANISM="Thalassionema frauenfeldii, Strain CCMP 1798" /LENGTH=379 /DNA_ID=CAMNT_0020580281 /DNA_START=54 /DNA_END=1193 /DNA_ORIENTATION=+
MSEEKKSAVDLAVTEKMQQMSMDGERDETPPPGRDSNSLHLLPIKEPYCGANTHESPPRLGTQVQNFRPKLHNARHHELTPVMRNVSFVEECPNANLVSPDDINQPISMPDQIAPLNALPLKINKNKPFLEPIPLVDRTQSLVNLRELVEDYQEEEVERVPLPSRNHFFSFNSRHQYAEQTKDSSEMEQSSLTPYQPQRHDLTEIAGIEDDDLSLIFAQKDRNPIPMNERQLSIPSIRMANRLVGGSIATFDTDCDEEDDLKDDASWSTRGSSLYMPEDSFDPPSAQGLGLNYTSTKHEPVVIVEGGDLLLENFSEDNEESVNAVQGRKRKSKPEDQAAYDWLRTIGGDSAIAEAASSKFLTQERPNQYSRQHSSPGDF